MAIRLAPAAMDSVWAVPITMSVAADTRPMIGPGVRRCSSVLYETKAAVLASPAIGIATRASAVDG